MNRSFTKSNSSLRARKENPDLLAAKDNNIKLAKLHEDSKLQLRDLDKKEDIYINLNFIPIDKKINQLTKYDLKFYRKESEKFLIKLLDRTQVIESKMYDNLDKLHKLILQINDDDNNSEEKNDF